MSESPTSSFIESLSPANGLRQRQVLENPQSPAWGDGVSGDDELQISANVGEWEVAATVRCAQECARIVKSFACRPCKSWQRELAGNANCARGEISTSRGAAAEWLSWAVIWSPSSHNTTHRRAAFQLYSNAPDMSPTFSLRWVCPCVVASRSCFEEFGLRLQERREQSA
jgi:hypothetical protein